MMQPASFQLGLLFCFSLWTVLDAGTTKLCSECAICRGDVPSDVTNFMKFYMARAFDAVDWNGDSFRYRSLENVNRFKDDTQTNLTLEDFGSDCSKTILAGGRYNESCMHVDFIIKDESNVFAETYCSIMSIPQRLINHTLDDDGDNNFTEASVETLLDGMQSYPDFIRGYFNYPYHFSKEASFSASFCDVGAYGYTSENYCNHNFSMVLDTETFSVHLGAWMEDYSNTSSELYSNLTTSADLLLLEMYKLTWAHTDATTSDGKTRITEVADHMSKVKVTFELDILHTHFFTGSTFSPDQMKALYKLARNNALAMYPNNTVLMDSDTKLMTAVEANVAEPVKISGSGLLHVQVVNVILANIVLMILLITVQ